MEPAAGRVPVTYHVGNVRRGRLPPARRCPQAIAPKTGTVIAAPAYPRTLTGEVQTMGRRGPSAEEPSSPRPTLSATQDAILVHIEERPGSSIRAVADALNLGHSTVQYNIGVLADRGLLETVRVGRKVRSYQEGTGRISRIAALLRHTSTESYLSTSPLRKSAT